MGPPILPAGLAGWDAGISLRSYHRMLQDLGDLDRMTALATDRGRFDRMLDVSGGDAAALAEITVAQDISAARIIRI